MFVTAKYTRHTKSKDAMYIWLENVNSGSFEVCIREFLPFDGKHQDTIVVGSMSSSFLFHFKFLLPVKPGYGFWGEGWAFCSLPMCYQKILT